MNGAFTAALAECSASVYLHWHTSREQARSPMRYARCLVLAAMLLSTGAAPLAAQSLRLVLDSAHAPQHIPILLAAERGHFARAGIEMLIEPGLGANMAAVLVGQRAFDLGHISALAAASAISSGTPIRMVAIYQPRTSLAFVGLQERVTLTGPKSVEGLRLGITPGTVDSVVLSLFRRNHNMGISALTITPIERSAKLDEVIAGRLDIVLGDSVAMRAALLAQGQEPAVLELAEHGVPLLGLGFIASQALLTSNPGLVRRALTAIRAGFVDAAADPGAACRETNSRHGLAKSDEACTRVLSIFLAHVAPATDGWGQQSPEAWQRMIAALRAVGEIQGTRPPSFYYTNAVIP